MARLESPEARRHQRSQARQQQDLVRLGLVAKQSPRREARPSSAYGETATAAEDDVLSKTAEVRHTILFLHTASVVCGGGLRRVCLYVGGQQGHIQCVQVVLWGVKGAAVL